MLQSSRRLTAVARASVGLLLSWTEVNRQRHAATFACCQEAIQAVRSTSFMAMDQLANSR